MLYAPFRNLAVPGSVRYFGSINPTTSGTLDDWTPTDFDNARNILVEPSGATTITGLGDALEGIEKLIVHAGLDDFPITLKHQDSGSTSELRLEHGSVGDFVLHRGDTALYQREIGTPRWRLMSRHATTYDSWRWPSCSARTEASWWKVPGSCSRQRYGMAEAESMDGSVALSIDDATGPLMSHSTGTTSGDACGLRTGARLFQRRWNPISGWERVSAPSTLSDTRARWGNFATFEIYGVSDPADLEGAYFQFDYSDDVALVKAITSDGASFTETELPTAPPGTQANWAIDQNSTRVRFYHNRSLVAEHDTDLPAPSTPLSHSIAVETLTNAAVKRFTWARSWYSFGRANE